MALQIQKLFILVIGVQILMPATVVECKFAKSFAGGLAGTVIGKAISNKLNEKHHHHYGTPQTTVERGETMANGCYKEKVKEPDTSRPDKFIETEKLICPPVMGAGGTGDVIVLSTKTGSYYGNSGSALMQTGFAGLVLVAVAACFL